MAFERNGKKGVQVHGKFFRPKCHISPLTFRTIFFSLNVRNVKNEKVGYKFPDQIYVLIVKKTDYFFDVTCPGEEILDYLFKGGVHI